jgi:hypothetical protein
MDQYENTQKENYKPKFIKNFKLFLSLLSNKKFQKLIKLIFLLKLFQEFSFYFKLILENPIFPFLLK